VSLIVLLDADPLVMITNPKSAPENEACKDWLASLVSKGVEVVIPEIADYEVRRELLRAGKDRGLGRLDALKGILGYTPSTTPVMLKAAEFWPTCRRSGQQLSTSVVDPATTRWRASRVASRESSRSSAISECRALRSQLPSAAVLSFIAEVY